MLKIGKIPYLNSVLFYYGLESNPETLANLEFAPMVPRRLTAAALDEQLDAGPVPVVTTFDIAGTYEQLGDFCIATKDKARSILFYSRKPIKELDGARIGITTETSTSVRLLKVLFAQLYRVTPAEYVSVDVSDDAPNDGVLLIGDEALRHRKGYDGYPHVADLGEVWHDATGLPFVFAAWVVRRALPDEQKEYIKAVLDDSLNEGWRHLEAAVAGKMEELDMTRAEVREYLDGFHFRMGAAEHDAMAKFAELDDMTRNLEIRDAAEAAE